MPSKRDNAVIGIVVSRADYASERIGDALLDLADWERLDVDHFRTEGYEIRQYNDLHLDLEDIADDFDDPAFLVFVSRHSGETGPLLSAHFTGNLGVAEYGGTDRTVAPACPNAQRGVLQALDKHVPPEYDVSLECTHHGPSDPGAPAMFVELGSSDEQWNDPAGAEVVAQAVLDIRDTEPNTDRTFVAFGPGHYVPRPTRIVRETNWACGHIAADWALDDLGNPSQHSDVIDQLFTQSSAEFALVEGDRPALEETIETLGYRIVGETWLQETDAIPLDLVERLETGLSPVDEGLRFGDHADSENEYTVVDLADELLSDANGIDMDAITDAARATSVAYETVENGNRVSGRAAFPSESRYDEFVEAVCRVLERKYDRVDRGGEIVVHERAFDPEKAVALGVPEGPKFGALAAGESVEVDGRTVRPSEVTVDRTRQYPR